MGKDLDFEGGKLSFPQSSSAVASRGFEVSELLAEGGQAAVYKVKNRTTRFIEAAKIYLPSKNPEVTKAAKREAELMSELKGVGALAVRHSGEARVIMGERLFDRFAIVMEYADQGSLRKFLASNDATLRDRFDFATGLAEAVQRSHEKDIIHRDIKLGNVVLQKFNGYRVALTDFGSATKRGEVAIPDTGTHTVTAPERFRGGVKATVEMDIYSLGMTMGELFTGQLLTELVNKNGRAHLKSQMGFSEAMDMSGWLMTPLHEKLESLILQCIEKDPAKRPHSAEEVLDRLKTAQRELKISMSPALWSTKYSLMPSNGPQRTRRYTSADMETQRAGAPTPGPTQPAPRPTKITKRKGDEKVASAPKTPLAEAERSLRLQVAGLKEELEEAQGRAKIKQEEIDEINKKLGVAYLRINELVEAQENHKCPPAKNSSKKSEFDFADDMAERKRRKGRFGRTFFRLMMGSGVTAAALFTALGVGQESGNYRSMQEVIADKVPITGSAYNMIPGTQTVNGFIRLDGGGMLYLTDKDEVSRVPDVPDVFTIKTKEGLYVADLSRYDDGNWNITEKRMQAMRKVLHRAHISLPKRVDLRDRLAVATYYSSPGE